MESNWTTDEEAQRLHKRFEFVNQAKFARDFNVPGGSSMLSQHIKGRRPINLESAMAYARGFGCPLSEISPRLAAEVSSASRITGGVSQIEDIRISGLENWRLQASSKSQEVIDQLTLLAKKNKLRDEDWLLIEQMVQRFVQK